MTNQQIVDRIENELPYKLPTRVKEQILDAMFQILNDELGIDIEPEEAGSKGEKL